MIPKLVPASPIIEANQPPTAPAPSPITKGLTKRKLTPKIAGSVIPNPAESAAGKARALSFLDFVFTATAKVAPA